MIVVGGYLIENADRARTGSPALTHAHADAADVNRSLTGFRASRVHLTEAGVSIDDQAR